MKHVVPLQVPAPLTVLCADIGGTNFRLACIEVAHGEAHLLHRGDCSTSDITDPERYFTSRLVEWSQKTGKHIDALSIAIAGPVIDGIGRMTNAHLEFDRKRLEAATGLPVVILNDLAAISWGTAMLDHDDKNAVLTLNGNHSIQSPSETHDVRTLVIAPGTGLGVSTMVRTRHDWIVLDMEAGHTPFVPETSDEADFLQHLRPRFPNIPGWEQFVSGQGIENLYLYYQCCHADTDTSAMLEIEHTPWGKRGALISKYSASDPHCASIMRAFASMLSRFASYLAISLLPRDGLYLAGGIPAHNIAWLVDDDLFLKGFVKNYLPALSQLLSTIPVRVVLDPEVGLYGAALAYTVESTR